jgi:hypothetical protein
MNSPLVHYNAAGMTTDYRSILHQIQKTIHDLDLSGEGPVAIGELAEKIATNFQELGITGGRLYEYRGEEYELIHRFGTRVVEQLGIVVSDEYRPIRLLLENGVIVMDPNAPEVDPTLETQLGASRFAAVALGDDDYILSFDVSPDSSHDDILFSLTIVRAAINNKLRVDRFHSIIEETKRIQQSLLPNRRPQFPGFDIWGRSVPAEQVSGDYFDFLALSENSMGIAIADATGHGLPAALMVRDVHMGLRMAADRELKIVRTIQRLNQIIHHSRLTTKFVTLFYGELETSGTFIYTNAGHSPPSLLHGDRWSELRYGGVVLGPTPDATYTRGYISIEPGDVLCLYSDGITEAADVQGREYGIDRLRRLVKRHRNESSEQLCNRILDSVNEWSREDPDDRTIVIVRRLGS